MRIPTPPVVQSVHKLIESSIRKTPKRNKRVARRGSSPGLLPLRYPAGMWRNNQFQIFQTTWPCCATRILRPLVTWTCVVMSLQPLHYYLTPTGSSEKEPLANKTAPNLASPKSAHAEQRSRLNEQLEESKQTSQLLRAAHRVSKVHQ
jgi:hypothetical protein